MNDKFYNLAPEKKQRIINAAVKEFIRSGYERASTNEIVKEAQISKGSLFNYFNNKKEMYFFLFDYMLKITDKIFGKMNWNETDIFIRIREISLIKFEVLKQFPEVFDFLQAVIQENAGEVKQGIAERVKLFKESSFAKMYEGIDLTKFRDDIDIRKTIKMINWSLIGFGEEYMDHLQSPAIEGFDMDQIVREMDSYLEIMKRCFYK